jgi:hypothetical protein
MGSITHDRLHLRRDNLVDFALATLIIFGLSPGFKAANTYLTIAVFVSPAWP